MAGKPLGVPGWIAFVIAAAIASGSPTFLLMTLYYVFGIGR